MIGRNSMILVVFFTGTVIAQNQTNNRKTGKIKPNVTIDGNSEKSIAKSLIANGGGTSKSGPYILTGSIGQPMTIRSASTTYQITAGFWQENRDLIYFSEFE